MVKQTHRFEIIVSFTPRPGLTKEQGANLALKIANQTLTQEEALDLGLDDIEFNFKSNENVLTITISRCHWHELMIKSNREYLSPRVGETICNTEYSGWAQEFGEDISFHMLSRICDGGEECVLQFSKS